MILLLNWIAIDAFDHFYDFDYSDDDLDGHARHLGEVKFKQKGREEQCEPDNPTQAKKVMLFVTTMTTMMTPPLGLLLSTLTWFGKTD